LKELRITMKNLRIDFYPEGGIRIFLQNIGGHVPDCTVS
jgi:hypothetical protein